ncbi:HalOD1 output domain-containing protein [Haloterrigena alkaliphila]|uniref:Halobacterial output domain-containing protein n=1 Tax=Haloterrigena alkaliphila TaxID=2816475 RepID=A0A8A2VB32_9EURY|nr:HalOD1 output domain-containing protein [Haloterrigena alkaliphila]QSW97642.1 hypothetical protein J0X25_09425 [Haloterrigena alkaliphila]
MVDQSKTDGGNQGWSDGSTPSEAVIETIAKETANDPLELPPLSNAIDPEALDRLFDNRQGGTVTFCCCEYVITVKPDGTVAIHER